MKTLHTISIILLAITVAILGLFAYWTFIEDDVIEIKNVDSFQVNKAVYRPGERVAYTFEYCKRKKSVGTIDRALVDGYRQNYSTIHSDLPTGCHTVTSSDLEIPSFIIGSKDIYHIEGTAVHQVNPLKKQYIYWRTVDFKIE